MDLFDAHRDALQKRNAPLADRMRPRTLEEFAGQEHIVGPGRLLRRAIQADQLSSLIFYGPPGTGKTTLARIIANTTRAQFLSINAVLAGVKDIREAIEQAQQTLALYSKRTILFIDEVHRFNKSQQDALLPHVENGVIVLIGATTENPYFEVNKALVSRSRIFQLRSLTDDDLRCVARMALADGERGYGALRVAIDDDALEHLVKTANGDARGVLNALQLAVETTPAGEGGAVRITRAIAEESIQQKAVLYDKDGDAHYDTISAFIKSVRGSDPDAALYWMARMVYAGEDPRFIFRRLLILASEDVGLADPKALGVVVNAARAFDYVGLPEGRFHLAHACLYLATAPKSNSAMAFFDALAAVAKEAEGEVPNHLRDASRDSEDFGHGQGYLYPHAYRDHWVAQQYLPSSLQGKIFFQPSDQGYEQLVKETVARRREAMIEAMEEQEADDPFSGAASLTEGKTGERWVKRTSSDADHAAVRDRLLELAEVGRESLVVDLRTNTGLLAFEAARRVREGGVWALVHSRRSLDALSALAKQLNELSRPRVVLTNWSSFDADIRAEAGTDVRFSAIVGRNVLSRSADKAGLATRAAALLAPGGILALAETVASQGQRLSDLLVFAAGESALARAFGQAEQALFADAADPFVNWTLESLQAELAAAQTITVRGFAQTSTCNRRVLPGEVEFWLRRSNGEGRASLGDRLREVVGEEEMRRVRTVMHAQLDNKDVPWKTVTGYLKIGLRVEAGNPESRSQNPEAGHTVTDHR